MKLKKNLILSSILAISVFVSSTSYASDTEPIMQVNQKKLTNMANKVDEHTIITDVTLPKKEGGKDKAEGSEKPKEENPNKNPESQENPESGEANGEATNPENPEGQENPENPENAGTGKGDSAEGEAPADPNKVQSEGKDEGNPDKKVENLPNQGPKPNTSLKGDSQTNKLINPGSPNMELMNRLNNIKNNENAQNQPFYIVDSSPKSGSLERLTSKETLTTSFKDKGSNLRLNLANTADNDSGDTSKYIIRPQTLILLIAILGAIFSAISIAIRGRGPAKKDS